MEFETSNWNIFFNDSLRMEVAQFKIEEHNIVSRNTKCCPSVYRLLIDWNVVKEAGKGEGLAFLNAATPAL